MFSYQIFAVNRLPPNNYKSQHFSLNHTFWSIVESKHCSHWRETKLNFNFISLQWMSRMFGVNYTSKSVIEFADIFIHTDTMLRVKNNNNGTWHEIYYGYFLTTELEILKPWRWNSKYVFLTLLFSVYWQLFRTAVPPFKPLSTFNVTHYHLGIFKTKKIQIERRIKKNHFPRK